jgi:hypothetical protein
MKKCQLKNKILLLLAIFCNSSIANIEWLYLGSAKQREFDYYIRPNYENSDENIRIVWVMFNYSNKSREVKSAVALNEYDCISKKVRTNYLIQFSKGMAKGEALTSSSPTPENDYWKTVDNGTVSETILTVVCKYDRNKLNIST